jgi:hypothetical protein
MIKKQWVMWLKNYKTFSSVKHEWVGKEITSTGFSLLYDFLVSDNVAIGLLQLFSYVDHLKYSIIALLVH